VAGRGVGLEESGTRLRSLALCHHVAPRPTVWSCGAPLRAYAPDADSDRVNAYANMTSGAAEQLGRWWVNSRHVSRETIGQYHAEFLWSGSRELRQEPAATDAGRARDV
jgi:hypothetical protein